MLVREANGPVWHWSVPQGSISARFSWATHSWGNRHCCMLGHPNMQQCLWDVPAVWLAADRLTPASSSPPYHYQPSLSNQHVKHFPLPPKYLTQPCHTLEAYTSDLLPSMCLYVLQHFCWTLSFHIFCFWHCQRTETQTPGHSVLALNWNSVSCYTAVCCLS